MSKVPGKLSKKVNKKIKITLMITGRILVDGTEYPNLYLSDII
jgi:hypothetical protein